jgi:flagellin
MAVTINTNIMSLNAQRHLGQSQSALATSMERLSSGLRINSAKDDAAGLYSVAKMTADVRGMNQAIRNAADGISLGQTAEGALGQIEGNLQRIREIAVQSANGTVEDRTGLQAEVDQLTQEISRIIETSEFNGTALLRAAAGITFQVGQDGLASNQVTVSSVNSTTLNSYAAGATGTTTVDVSTSSAASAAIADLESDIEDVASNRATFGAVQNRFEAVISNLQVSVESVTASRSRIQDADFAQETAALTRSQILQQAGVSMLAQANTAPQTALALLQ